MIKFLELKDNLRYRDFSEALYEEAFPPEERWNFSMTLENKRNQNYDFYVILDEEIAVGLALVWNFSEFTYIEYLAIDKKFRGKNYGSSALTKILDSLKDKLIVIEVEPCDLNEWAKKRVDWYLRHGFILSKYDYDMPCAADRNGKKEIGSMRMKIMTTREIKDKEEHDSITDYIYKNVYKPRLDEIDEWR